VKRSLFVFELATTSRPSAVTTLYSKMLSAASPYLLENGAWPAVWANPPPGLTVASKVSPYLLNTELDLTGGGDNREEAGLVQSVGDFLGVHSNAERNGSLLPGNRFYDVDASFTVSQS
jgi:hypothetical protein